MIHVALVARLAVPLVRADDAVLPGLQQFAQTSQEFTRQTVQFVELTPSEQPLVPSGGRDPRLENPLVDVADPAIVAASSGTRGIPVEFVDGGAGLPPSYVVTEGVVASSAVPGFGTGVLWEDIEVSIATEGQIAAGVAQLALLDGELFQRIRSFLDTIPADSFAFGEMPTWLIEAGGEKWGIEGGMIHLGPIKLPAFLLALLPIPATGDFERGQEAAALERMRQEVIRQARMMESREEIRNYIEATRQRQDEERARRLEEEEEEEPPDPVAPVPADTVVS